MYATYSDLAGQSVFITGGGSGIGAFLTEGFLRAGCKVAFVQRSDAGAFCDDMEEKVGIRPLFIPCDITDVERLQLAVGEAASKNGAITVLVNNAANDERHGAEDVSVDYWDWNLSLNLRSYFFACQAVLDGMRANGGGSIINFSSIAYIMGHTQLVCYTTSNSGINGMTRTLAREWGPDKIRVNALAPGWVLTQKQKDLWVTPEGLENHLEMQSLKEPIQPEDIVDPVLFLASRASRMMTGQALVVDGGLVVTGMTALKWIAVDWGTTHLRVWGMGASDEPLFHASSTMGMGAVETGGFEPALMDLVEDYVSHFEDSITVIACGMVGSRQGWIEAPYRSVPCQPLSEDHVKSDGKRFEIHVISGLRQDRPADVMRGEEVQIAGYLSLNEDFDGVMCLPGSHTKWARISAEEVVSFQTVMTGEMFAVISNNTVLRHSLMDEGLNETLFLEAVEEGMAHPARLTSRLFSLRAEGLLFGLSAPDVRSRLSGLLIGMELAATKPYWLGEKIAVVGAEALSSLYVKALEEQGNVALVEDGLDMTLKGLVAVRHQMERLA